MSNFLLEIGTEELPAQFARSVITQLEELVTGDFHDSRLGFEEIRCSTTPRRILVFVKGVSEFSDDFVEERKGPPSTKALENGLPTKAAIGFANRYGISVDDLEARETPKGSFLFGKIVEKGESSFAVLSRLIPKWINKLQGNRFMYWGVGDMRFARPIRWLVSLIDEKELFIELIGTDPKVTSGSLSRGLRLNHNYVSIKSASSYHSDMREAGIVVDREQRVKIIKDLVQESSNELCVNADLTSNLLNELTDLVESPYLIRGEFDQCYLGLPPEVLSTVMKVHQRYIPLYVRNIEIDPLSLDARNVLSPYFLCVCNGLNKSNDLIKEGNQRVLKARFSDAQFFIDVDRSSSSLDRIEQLKKVTFVDGLGSLFDRVKRIEWLADVLIEHLNCSDINLDHLRRAAKLCKHDLVSNMVGEFPELQGIIGGKYLLAEGEPREVALAVLEQYLPRGQGDNLPASLLGSSLSILDRVELLLSIYAKGERPSGSSDPYALRRAANGVVQIIWEKQLKVNLFEMLSFSLDNWSNHFQAFTFDSKKIKEDIFEFFHQRIFNLLDESGYDLDLVHAVSGETISNRRILSDPSDVLKRVDLLTEMRKSNSLNLVQSVVNRASKLAEKTSLSLDILSASKIVDTSLFEKDSESSMLEVVNFLEPIAKSDSPERYQELANGLASSSKVLSEFFDGDQSVMVMTENLRIRENRLNLLGVLRNQAYIIADFNVINN